MNLFNNSDSHESIQVKRATLDDVIKIAELNISNYKIDYHPYSVDLMLKKLFLNIFKKRWIKSLLQGMNTLILTKDDEFIGFMSYSSYSEDTVEINSIYLIPTMRGKKLGKFLCHYALTKIQEDNFKHVFVWILERCDFTKRFYENMGFKATSDVRTDQLKEDLELVEIKYSLVIP